MARKKARTVGPSVVGPTPATEDQPFGLSIQARQAAQDAAMGEAGPDARKQVKKLKPASFFTAPPRTEIFEKDADGASKDSFKPAAAAPANLGAISGRECVTARDEKDERAGRGANHHHHQIVHTIVLAGCQLMGLPSSHNKDAYKQDAPALYFAAHTRPGAQTCCSLPTTLTCHCPLSLSCCLHPRLPTHSSCHHSDVGQDLPGQGWRA